MFSGFQIFLNILRYLYFFLKYVPRNLDRNVNLSCWLQISTDSLQIPRPIYWSNHASLVAVFTQTYRPPSVRNRCVIKVFGCVFVLLLRFWEFSVGVRPFVIGLSKISSFFSLYTWYLTGFEYGLWWRRSVYNSVRWHGSLIWFLCFCVIIFFGDTLLWFVYPFICKLNISILSVFLTKSVKLMDCI